MNRIEQIYFIILMFLFFMVAKTFFDFIVEEIRNGGDDFEE